ncbi:MAG: SdpI family protein [Lachnospiraceae bacterium]|nr:SdpI family protein [Lachnospiraceae bacterium]MEE1341299.1 SdpI family protein [Lachnospiraceae bacterium]
MAFWIFMLCMILLVPLTMICFGRIFLKNPPKEINSIYGYRTPRSTKNIETWKFAHHYSGKLWFQWGVILLPLSILPMFFLLGKSTDEIGTWGSIICLLQIIPLVGVIFPTEAALKKTFDENGNKKIE